MKSRKKAYCPPKTEVYETEMPQGFLAGTIFEGGAGKGQEQDDNTFGAKGETFTEEFVEEDVAYEEPFGLPKMPRLLDDSF